MRTAVCYTTSVKQLSVSECPLQTRSGGEILHPVAHTESHVLASNDHLFFIFISSVATTVLGAYEVLLTLGLS
jgi:hypothetical protein